MKKILLLSFLSVPMFMFGQSNIQVFRAGSGSSTNSAAVAAQIHDSLTGFTPGVNEAAVASQISDSLENITLGVDIATSADSVLVMDDGKLKIMSKAEFLADIYSALNQMSGLDLIAPTIDSIEIGRYNDSILVAFFHESDIHVDSIPPVSAFNLTEGGTTVGLDTILFSATGDSLMVVMDSLAEYGSNYLLDYTKAYTHVQDSSGNDLANFSDMAVINYVSEPETPPTNMIYNGTFDSSVGWTESIGSGNWVIANGVATWDDIESSNLNQISSSMNSPILPNTAYTLTFDMSGTTVAGMYFSIWSVGGAGASVQYVAPGQYANGSRSVSFTTPADIMSGGIAFRAANASDCSGSIDNIVLLPQ